MQFIRPTPITSTNLTYSSIPALNTPVDPAAWATGTTYTLGQRASKGDKVWENLLASNAGKDPQQAWTPPAWIEVGPVNRHAMFDKVVGTRTTNAGGSIIVEVLPGSCDSVALLDIEGYTAKLSIKVSGSEVWTVTENVGDQAIVNDWLDYFNEPIVPKTSIIFYNVPNYAGATYRLELTSSLPVAIGTAVFGKMFDLGFTQYGTTFGIIDYSRKTTNEYGIISVTERGFAKRINTKVELDNYKIDDVDRVLSAIRATPVVWIGAGNQYTSLITYGFYKDWSVEIAYHNTSYCSLQIEGLT